MTVPTGPDWGTPPGIVDRVIDGDTIWIRSDRGMDTWVQPARLRIKDLWCAELHEEAGKRAFAYVQSLVKPGDVVLHRTYRTKAIDLKTLDRYLVDVFFQPVPGGMWVDLAAVVVEAGHGFRTKAELEAARAT